MIEFRYAEKTYGSRQVVKPMNMTFEKGKIYGILGPNGSGKSTTLKMIAGLVHPTKGEVLVDGQLATRKIAAKVAYLSDSEMLYPSFSIKDMAQYFSSQYPDFSVEQSAELLEFMKLQPSQKIRNLSKGEKGRLKLALVLSRRAPIVLLDEPFSGLDPMVRETVAKSLLTFLDFGEQTVLIATHEIDEIEPLLEEAVIMSEGEIIAETNVEELREQEGLSVLQWLKRQAVQKGE